MSDKIKRSELTEAEKKIFDAGNQDGREEATLIAMGIIGFMLIVIFISSLL